LFSSPQNGKPDESSPFVTVVMAGRTGYGGWCECGTPGCICDPDELPGGNLVARSPGDEPLDKTNAPDVDPMMGAMVMMLALLFWLRLR
jgi:hypothetical protein